VAKLQTTKPPAGSDQTPFDSRGPDPWSELSRHAHELPAIVDECVAAAETALGLRIAVAATRV
jgi:hypothetical protein